MPHVTVYSKPKCVQCNATYRDLDRLGLDYTKVDMSQDPNALDEILAKGFQSAPVVVVGEWENSWSGYQPEKIAELAS